MMNNKILHITWKNEDLSEKQNFILKRWSILNPNLKIKYYTDNTNEQFVKSNYPEYEPVINKIDRIVMKLDFIRLLYVYHYGGIYSDFDVLPLKSIEPLLDLNEVVICEEDKRNAKNFNVERILSNAIIIAKPKSNFIKHLIDDIVSNIDSPKINSKNPNDILEMTGPLFFNRAYSSYGNKHEITILDNLYFNPMTFYDIKEGKINNNIEFSFLIHLYDGTWWQEEHNSSLEYLNKLIKIHDGLILHYNEDYKKSVKKYIENNFIVDMPKVSCLCVTKNKEHILRDSIISYKNQIYPNKELIVIYEDDNNYISNVIQEFNSEDIKYFKISTKNKKTLGELRNISIEKSKGDYVCQWDDDDWYNPLRIWEQFRNMKLNKKKGSILNSWLVYDNVKNDLKECRRFDIAGWEGSFLYEKSSLKNLYPSIVKGEDTVFIKNIEKDLSILYKPELYVYRVHSENTWGYENLYNKIVNHSIDYNKILSFNFIKNKKLLNLNGIFGDVIINNQNFDISEYQKMNKNYDAGIVVSTNGNYDELKRTLDSLNNMNTNKNVLLIFLDNSDSYKNLNVCKKSKELLLKYEFKNFNNIKIFKKLYSNKLKDQKTGFDILQNDFNCEYFMSLDIGTIVKKNWLDVFFEPVLFSHLKTRTHILNGFTKDYQGEKSYVNTHSKPHKFNSKLERYHIGFKSEIYNELKLQYNNKAYVSLLNNEDYLKGFSDYIMNKKGLLYSPHNSVIDLQNHKNGDIPFNFYYEFQDIKYVFDTSKKENKIPPVIHRLLLSKESDSDNLKEFAKNTKDFYTIVWEESDVLRIMNYEEVETYTGYVNDIQKYEYAKYIILKYMGGIYCDLYVTPQNNLNEIYNSNSNLDELFAEDSSSMVSKIVMSKPHSDNVQQILNLCRERKDIEINKNLDALKTVGPDVVNEVFEANKSNITYLKKDDYKNTFTQNKKRDWEKVVKNNKSFKISVIMQSYLGDYPGSRSEPKRKFIRAVNSFLNQTNKNTELIIVSDNCKITERLYKENFSNENRIKFKFCEKKGKKMYEKDSKTIYFVGEPRQHGVDMSSGEIITYMDSDDMLTKFYLEKLAEYWKYNYGLSWIINKCWWDNIKVMNENVVGYNSIFDTQLTDEHIEIEDLDSKWVKSYVKKDVVLQSPGLISHKKECDVKWSDVSSNGADSEDIAFYKKMLDKYTKGKHIHLFGYVRCHEKNSWDY